MVAGNLLTGQGQCLLLFSVTSKFVCEVIKELETVKSFKHVFRIETNDMEHLVHVPAILLLSCQN